MKINLYLMSKKGLCALGALVDKGYSAYINEVCIGKDSGVTADFSDEIMAICKEYDLKWYYKGTTNKSSKADYSIAVSWRWILKDIEGLIVVHDSLLPKYRGFAPLISQLVNGETTLGVSAIWAGEDYDTGNIINQQTIEVRYPIKIHAAIDAITNCYVKAILFIFECLTNGIALPSTPQRTDNITYSLWLDDEDYWIDWSQSAERIARFIDAVGSPYRGARTLCNGEKIIVQSATYYPDVVIENRQPGKVIKINGINPIIVCGIGLLKLESCIYANTGKDALPLKKFRSRFNSPSQTLK